MQLIIYHNNIGDTGMSYLAEAIPKNTNLHMINLRHNQVRIFCSYFFDMAVMHHMSAIL